jgi:hypothetical protein
MNKLSQKLSLAWNSFKLVFFARAFWRNRPTAILLSGSIFLNFIIWYLWYFKIRVSGYPISSPISLLRISEKLNFYFLPIVGLLIIILNTFLAVYSYRKESLASYFLLGTAFFVQILILIFLLFFIRYSSL